MKGQAALAAAALGIETSGDLLEHLPHSHRDRRDVTAVASLALEEQATVEVTVKSVAVRPMRDRRRKRVEARVSDESGPAVAVWFNQPWVARQLTAGARVRLHGRLKKRNQFWVAEHEVVADGGAEGIHTAGLVPVYPATEKLPAARLRTLVWEARARITDAIEPLPAMLRVRERLPDRSAALAAAHFPERPGDHETARRRLALEELLLLEVTIASRRRMRRESVVAPRVTPTGELVGRGSTRFRSRLLTTSVKRSARSTASSTRRARCSAC